MVEYTLGLDAVFGSLADPTRRDILNRVARSELSVSEISQPYDMSLAAVSKHLKILEQARLITKRRKGRQHLVSLAPGALRQADDYLKFYQQFWTERLEALEVYIEEQEI